MNDNNQNYNEQSTSENEYVYQTAMEGKPASRAWSVTSLVLGIISIICCCFMEVSLVAAVLAVITSIVSRKNLGYFDGLAIAGLITAIFGLVIFLSGIIGEAVMGDQYEQFFNEWLEKYAPQIPE